MNVTKKSLYALFLAGSLCSFNTQASNDQDAEHRLQITGATRQILAAIDASNLDISGNAPGTVIVGGTTYTPDTNDLTSLSLGIAAVEGTNATGTVIVGAADAYTAGTNNLTAISQGLSAVEGASFAASASLAALAGLDVPAGTALTPGNTYTAGTNDLTSLSLALSTIEGTNGATGSFTMALASLYIISRQVALSQVIAAASSAALELPVVTSNDTNISGAAYTALIATVFTDLKLAMATPSYATITTLNGAVAAAVSYAITTPTIGTISSAYPITVVQGVIEQLQTAVTNWLAFYPIGS